MCFERDVDKAHECIRRLAATEKGGPAWSNAPGSAGETASRLGRFERGSVPPAVRGLAALADPLTGPAAFERLAAPQAAAGLNLVNPLRFRLNSIFRHDHTLPYGK